MDDRNREFKPLAQRGVPILPYMMKYLRTAGMLMAIWGVGYYHFSPAWVLLFTFFSLFNEEYYSKVKFAKFLFARQSDTDEREAILARSDELPSWVFFPDVERAEWLNKMIRQMWPFIGEYVKEVLKTTVQPSVDNSLPSSLRPFKFEKINLGTVPPRVGGIKVYIENLKRDEILLDLELLYSSDAEIKVAVRGFTAGIKSLTIQGHLRVLMKPLVNKIPIIGGLQVYFLNPPAIDFDLTNTANVLDMPLLRNTLRTIISDQIAYYLVLPNKIPVTLCEGVCDDEVKYGMPQGVLRLHIVAGRDLKRADFKLVGKGKSDPYVKCYVGAQNFTTKVIKDTVAPVWNQYFEAAVDQKFGQFAELEVLDEDPGDDDELGECSLDIQNISEKGNIDTWLPLENVETGMIHVRALWLHLSKDPNDLDKMVAENDRQEADATSSEEHLSSALLMVSLDNAKNLPRYKKSMQEPSAYAKLTVGNRTHESVPRPKTANPLWEQNFEFLVHDPRNQELQIDIFDTGREKKRMGYVNVPLKTILSAPDMIIHRPYPIKETTAQTKLTLRLCLRILTSSIPEEWAQDIKRTPVSSSVDPDDKQPPESPPGEEVEGEPITPVDVGAGLEENNFQLGGDADAISDTSMELRQRAPTLNSQPSEPGLGRIQVTLRYSPQRSRLIAVIHKCMNLIPCDDDNLADPYVKIYLQPDKNSKRKTQVVKNNLNPVYDETFDWALSPTDLPTRMLEITVKNEVSLFSKNRAVMGMVQIDLNSFELTKPSTDWYELEEAESDKSNTSKMA